MAKILVIDDEAPIRRLLRDVLQREGHDVLEAPDGRRGMALVGANDFDVVITDIMMPEQDGIETLRQLKELDRNLKIVVISGGGHRLAMDFLPAAKTLGADLTFKKPFKPLEIAGAINELLGKARAPA